jgi:hypothetical protein
MTVKVNALQKFSVFSGIPKYIKIHTAIWQNNQLMKRHNMCGSVRGLFETLPQDLAQELSPCFGHETQIPSSLPRRVVEVTLSHGCMEVKHIFLLYGNNFWVFEKRCGRKYLQRQNTEYGDGRIVQLLVL